MGDDEKDSPTPQGFAMIDNIHSVVLPMDIALQVFALLCQGEKVSYDWQTKTHRIVNEGTPSLRMFSLTDMEQVEKQT